MSALKTTDDQTKALLLLEHLRLVDPGADVEVESLTGGVSSDIWLIRTVGKEFVLKHALDQLRVEADWHAPVERGAAEAAWLTFVAEVVPGAVPTVLAYDPVTHAIALEYLDPAHFKNWKLQLMAGDVDLEVATELGRVLGRIHSASAQTPGLDEQFANQEMFESLRIEPYFLRTTAAVPEAALAIQEVVDGLRSTKRALVHGDISPKNVLAGERVILLDAECATWGDPAFDVAFVLTHLTLKSLHLHAHRDELRGAARELVSSYLAQVDWEDSGEVLARVGRILPALILARVAGASPVEYLSKSERETVRAIALRALLTGESVEAILESKGDVRD